VSECFLILQETEPGGNDLRDSHAVFARLTSTYSPRRRIGVPRTYVAQRPRKNVVDEESTPPSAMITIFTSAFAHAARSPRSGTSIGLKVRVYLVARAGVRAAHAELDVPKRSTKPLRRYLRRAAALLNATTVIEDLTRLVGGDVVTLLCNCQRESFASGGLWCHLSCASNWLQNEPRIVVRTKHAPQTRP
jgi:hypothetical protein